MRGRELPLALHLDDTCSTLKLPEGTSSLERENRWAAKLSEAACGLPGCTSQGHWTSLWSQPSSRIWLAQPRCWAPLSLTSAIPLLTTFPLEPEDAWRETEHEDLLTPSLGDWGPITAFRSPFPFELFRKD